MSNDTKGILDAEPSASYSGPVTISEGISVTFPEAGVKTEGTFKLTTITPPRNDCRFCKEDLGLSDWHLCGAGLVHMMIDHIHKNHEDAAKLREALGMK